MKILPQIVFNHLAVGTTLALRLHMRLPLSQHAHQIAGLRTASPRRTPEPTAALSPYEGALVGTT